ncbi:MAG: exodeoxyribonuclease VII large subunit [Anaerolineae bacterium]|jgi:exodeoxyribonuclease VII large subunit|nr:exodeoxyribonuclease VII large subunit [Anaerolineae bacterium]
MFNTSNTTKTVTELTAHIRTVIESDPLLQGVWVSGEVSNMTRAASGHWYFTLKDATAQLKCVMWKSAAQRQTITPRDGDAIEVYGHISLYEPRGDYQFYADRVRPVGMGDLFLRFEELKARLNAEGLFDPARKRPIPSVIQRIGVVTSPDAAAFQDIQNVLRRRLPTAEIVISPTQVQGNEAPPQIVRALERIVTYGAVDVILLIRGGGSLEDLWCFNDERVARAVSDSSIPIVTGVGHEIDFTIVDFVSDYRAPTPSAAAEVISQRSIEVIRAELTDLQHNLTQVIHNQIDQRREQLDDYARTMAYNSPLAHVRVMRQRIDTLNARLTREQRRQVQLLRERVTAKTAALTAADPRAILKRGYAIITTADGARIDSVEAAPIGTPLLIQLADGEIIARSEGTPQDGLYQRPLI